MYYFDNETIMSLTNALELKPNEVMILEHVRTYEYENDEILPYFVEIRCSQMEVVVRKNKILDFPIFEVSKQEKFKTVEEAIGTYRKWISEIQTAI